MENNEVSLDSEAMAGNARTRASFYSMINVHFITLPDLAFVTKIRSSEFSGTLKSLAADQALPEELSAGASLMSRFLDDNASLTDTEISEKLGLDRTSLYRGLTPEISPPPPCEAVWSLTRPNVVELLQELSGIYRQSGMGLDYDIGERLDYIGVELDYMRQLAEKEAEAWQKGDTDTAETMLERQGEFFMVHLNVWTESFIEKALSMAKTDFYRGHLTMLRGFFAAEREGFQV